MCGSQCTLFYTILKLSPHNPEKFIRNRVIISGPSVNNNSIQILTYRYTFLLWTIFWVVQNYREMKEEKEETTELEKRVKKKNDSPIKNSFPCENKGERDPNKTEKKLLSLF